MKDLASASKIVLMILVLTLAVGVLWKTDVFYKTFDYAIVSVISFYFGQKVNEIKNEIREQLTGSPKS